MIKIRLSLKERAAAGLITGYSAGRFDWYMTRHAARCIRDVRAYPPQQARKRETVADVFARAGL
jgi:hypothetical protein